MRAESTSGCLSNDACEKAKHVDMQNMWIQEASKSGRFVTKVVVTSVNPADFMTKPMSRSKIEQLTSIMGCEFMRTETNVLKCQSART